MGELLLEKWVPEVSNIRIRGLAEQMKPMVVIRLGAIVSGKWLTILVATGL